MKPIAVAVTVFLFHFSISTGYRVHVRRSAEPSLADRNDLSNSVATSRKSLETPEDDPNLQNALQKVMREMDQKLNRTPFDANEYGKKTTPKLKLFFVSPSADVTESSLEETGIPDYSEYSQASRQIRGGDSENTATQFQTNEETNIQKPEIAFHRPDFPALSGSQDVLENFQSNGTRMSPNSSHADDKVEMKVELTINLSENDQHHHFHPGNHSEITAGNTSDHIHVSTKETGVKPIQNPKESDSVLNIASGNLNLNIKLMPHNHTGMTEHNGSHNVSDKVKQQPEKQGGARSLNVLDDSKNFETSTPKDKRNETHKAKKDVNNNEYMMNNTKLKNPQTSRKVRPAESDMDNGQFASEEPSSEKTPSTKNPSTTEPTPPQSEEPHDNTLSESLKAIIQNLTKYYANQNGGHPQDGENFIRNISKFLPGKGGTPEEQNYLEQLRKYLSQPNLFSQIGFPDIETLTDFETFLEVLKKLRRSKMVRESGYYPIISEYLNFYDILNPGTEETTSEEESWSYESSLVGSLLDYLFDDDSSREVGHKDKQKSQRSGSDDSPESESDEWDLL